jgi:hypothetical protein
MCVADRSPGLRRSDTGARLPLGALLRLTDQPRGVRAVGAQARSQGLV